MTPSSRWFALIVPNLLTLARVGLAIVFPFLQQPGRVAIVGLAALSDLLDGSFSRLFQVKTTFGQILDPIADKTFVALVLLTLLAEGTLSPWQIAFVGARDLAVVAGSTAVALLRGRAALRQLPPRLLGKATTGAQFLFLADVVYHQEIRLWLLGLTGTVSLLAGLDYLRSGRRPAASNPADRARLASHDETSQLQHP